MENEFSHSIVLRPFEIGDAENIQLYADDVLIACNLRDGFPHPYTLEHAIGFIEMVTHPTYNAIVRAITLNNEVIGSIGAHFKEDVYKKNAELGYWLGRPYHGRGIITHCVKELTALVFNNHDIKRIYAETFAENMASHRVLQKNGYVHEATLKQNVYKLNRYLDTYVFALMREDFETIQQSLK